MDGLASTNASAIAEDSGQQAASALASAPLASALAGCPAAFVSADVALGPEPDPVVGSFTVDGMTFSLSEDGATLVSVAPGAFGVDGPDGGRGEVGTSEPSAPSGPSDIPSMVAYGDAAYDVVAIGPYAFYLSGATEVALPASIASVDERAFRSSDVARVDVDPENPNLASFDGVLYDASLSRLLLIPGGRGGAVRVPDNAEEVPAEAFSHCAEVDAISVDEGSPAFSSWEGLLYDATGQTLLRVPAGVTDIAIREGCIAIAAGAMEGCARLESIEAPASVASISPDVFSSVPTVSLPAASLTQNEGEAIMRPQINVAVVLSGKVDATFKVDPAVITVSLPHGSDCAPWEQAGFTLLRADRPLSNQDISATSLASSSTYAASTATLIGNGGVFYSAYFGTRYSVLTHGSPGYVWRFQGTNGSQVLLLKAAGDYIDTITIEGRQNCTFLGWSPCFDINSPIANPKDIKTYGDYNFDYAPGWVANWRVRLTWDPNKGHWGTNSAATGSQTSDNVNMTTATSYNNSTLPQRNGYTFRGWSTQSGATSGSSTITVPNKPTTYFAAWTANPYSITLDSQGGTPAGPVSATYDADVTLPVSTRAGYAFAGWDTEADGTGTRYQANVALKKPNLATSGTAKLYAQWTPVISAELPASVTARVDLLGIEQQQEASGYIRSLCGEPLRVEAVECVPQPGAASLFGSRVKDVSLEAFAGAGATPAFSFALDATRTEADPASLAALSMPSLGDSVPIRYRFAIPDELLPSLVETEAALCQVSYTVALA